MKSKYKITNTKRRRRSVAKQRHCKHCNKQFKPTLKYQSVCSAHCPALTITYTCKNCLVKVTRPAVYGVGDYCSLECRQGKRPGKTVDKLDILKLHDNTCFLCDKPIDLSLKSPDRMSLTFDHVMPRSRGGRSDWYNLVPSHLICNVKKSNNVDTYLIRKLRKRLGFE